LAINVKSKTISKEHQATAVVSSALREFFFHGRETFEFWRKQLQEVVIESKLCAYTDDSTFPTYTELINNYNILSEHVDTHLFISNLQMEAYGISDTNSTSSESPQPIDLFLACDMCGNEDCNVRSRNHRSICGFCGYCYSEMCWFCHGHLLQRYWILDHYDEHYCLACDEIVFRNHCSCAICNVCRYTVNRFTQLRDGICLVCSYDRNMLSTHFTLDDYELVRHCLRRREDNMVSRGVLQEDTTSSEAESSVSTISTPSEPDNNWA
jgi:hypothetical protein